MLRLPPFRLLRPSTLEEAADMILSEGPAARLLAGGTDLVPNMKRRHQKTGVAISLMGIGELSGIETNGGVEDDGRAVRIGATTTLAEVASHSVIDREYPALRTAVESISSPPLREMGTIGGNVCVDTRCTYYNQTEEWRRSIDYCMKEDGEICWVATSSPRCWAHSASDSAPMLAALGAEVELFSADRGRRTVAVEDLYRDDGIEYLAKEPHEIVRAVHLPSRGARDRCRAAFWKLRRRGSIDFSVLSVAVALWLDGDTVADARIFLGAVASYPKPAKRAAGRLVGSTLSETAVAEAAELARKAAIPMDNTDFVPQWRKAVAGRYIEAALREAAGLPVERLAPKHRRRETSE